MLKLQQLAPTLQAYTSNPRNTSVNIRGLGVPFGLTSDGFEQGVGIYVDDVYNSRVAAATFDFLDVAQVEVLRGPQGTLYGKNTTAGAINITTNQPTFDFEGRAEVTAGNLDYKQAKAAVSGPLSRHASPRGWRSRPPAGAARCTTSRTQRWINEQDNLGLRAQLLWKPSDDAEHHACRAITARRIPNAAAPPSSASAATQRALARQYDGLVAAYNAANPTRPYAVPSRNVYDRLTDIDAPLQAGNKIGGASLRGCGTSGRAR